MSASERDLLGEWLRLGREMLERYYPETKYAVLVAEQGEGLPSFTLPLIPAASFVPLPVQIRPA